MLLLQAKNINKWLKISVHLSAKGQEISALPNFCSIFYTVSIAGRVKKRLSYRSTAYASRSTLAPVLLIYMILMVSLNNSKAFLWSAALAVSAPPQSIHP